MSRLIHMCVDIFGVLQKSDGYLYGYLQDDNGRGLSGAEVRSFFEEYVRTTGKKYFCHWSNQTPEGRCAGHEESVTVAGKEEPKA